MLEAMMLADGQKNGVFGKKTRPWVMDVFALLCALQGRSVLKRRFSSAGDVPLQMLKKSRFVYASQLQREDVGHDEVWCPTTEHGTWYARFSNGVVAITGNTGSVGRALALLGFEVRRGLSSREEMEKATRITHGEAQGSERSKPAPAPSSPPRPSDATPEKPTAKADKTASEEQKEEILKLLQQERPGDRRAQQKLLVEMTGKSSREELTEQDAVRLIESLKRASQASHPTANLK
jgi:hypothetical protein